MEETLLPSLPPETEVAEEEEEEKEEEEIKAINMLRNGKEKKGEEREREAGFASQTRGRKFAKCKVGLREVIFPFPPQKEKNYNVGTESDNVSQSVTRLRNRAREVLDSSTTGRR